MNKNQMQAFIEDEKEAAFEQIFISAYDTSKK